MTIPIDTAEYELIRAPVLDEFVYDRDGITFPVNRAFLTQVCDNHNAAAKNTGSPVGDPHAVARHGFGPARSEPRDDPRCPSRGVQAWQVCAKRSCSSSAASATLYTADQVLAVICSARRFSLLFEYALSASEAASKDSAARRMRTSCPV